MRKSERIRLLELQMVRIEMHLELLRATLDALLEGSGIVSQSDLDSGKWYQRKPSQDY